MTSMASSTCLKRCIYNVSRVLHSGKYIAGIDHNPTTSCSNNCVCSENWKPISSRRISSKSYETIQQTRNTLTREMINSSGIGENGDFVKYSTFSLQQNLKLEKFVSVLCIYGFLTDDCVKMAAICPEVLECSESQLLEVISSFRRCKCSNEEIMSLLKSCPHHFCASPDLIISRYFSLINIFSHKLVLQILSNCPDIMFCKWKVIQDKIEYLKNVMFLQNRQIAFSSALDFPLDTLKARHMFLERAGLFENSDANSATSRKNLRLVDIINEDDKYFAEEVAGLTLEEYRVFLEIFSSINEKDDDEETDEVGSEDSDEH